MDANENRRKRQLVNFLAATLSDSWLYGVIMQDQSPQILTEGNILEGDFWPEPVRVIALKKIGLRYQIITTGIRSRMTFNTTLRVDQVQNKLRITSAAPTGFNGDPSAFRLAVEAWRIRLAHEFDPHFAVSVSQIDPLPHQLEAIYHHMIPMPKLRFLLADDPGVGKTIIEYPEWCGRKLQRGKGI